MAAIQSLWNFFTTDKRVSSHTDSKVWAIGDIQGCYVAFRRLLVKIDFDESRDKLWIAGDLVNRGEGSLETLEYLYSIRDRVQIVLGNHDVALLAIYWGIKKSNPTLDPILESENVDKLIEWLRVQPFVHYDKDLELLMVHAGIPPEFDIDIALKYSKKLQDKLSGEDAPRWLRKKMSIAVDADNTKKKKNRYAINAFTRMRFCDKEGELNFSQKGAPNTRTYGSGLFPWFEIPKRKKLGAKVIFGHWSTLGYMDSDVAISLDTGCVWQGKMTAKRIDIKGGEIVQVDCPEGIKA